MMSEHTVSHVLAEQIITHPNDAILFVGYSDPETPAGKIKATNHGEMVRLREKGGQAYPLKCRVECFDFSGHATRRALIDYACQLKPKKVLLVHGDPAALDSLSQALKEELPGTDILVPEPGKPIRLD
jgi:predicted metal-dependent RNase